MRVLVPIEHIEIVQGVRGDTPRIVGTGIKVRFVAELFLQHQWTVEEIAEEFDLTPAQIHAALSYYYDHKDEIDLSPSENERKISSIIEQMESLLAQNNIQPDGLIYHDSGTFLIRLSENNSRYEDASRILESITGINIDKTFDINHNEGDGTETKQRYIKFKRKS